MDEYLVFVYGTLKAGRSNHRFLEDATFLGAAFTEANVWKMLDLGAFPALVESHGNSPSIIGELYAIDGAGLKLLDSLEGYPEFYNRKKIEIYVAGRSAVYEALVYYMVEPPANCHQTIESGVW